MIRRTLAALALCLAACGGSADTPIYRACTSDGDCVAGARCVAAWSPSTPKVWYCALDRRVRNTCEVRYPATDAHREVAAAIVEAVLLRLEGAR